MWHTLKSITLLVQLKFKMRLASPAALMSEVGIALFGNLSGFLGFYLLMQAFPQLGGFTMKQAGVLYGLVSLGFGTAQLLLSGFDDLVSSIQNGQLTLLLTRPMSPLVRIPLEGLRFARFGKVLEGLVILIWCLWSGLPGPGLPFLLLVASSVLFYSGLFLLVYALLLLFPSRETQALSILCYSIGAINRYPLSIYAPWLMSLLSTFVPLGHVHYHPLKRWLEGADALFSSGLSLLLSAGMCLLGILFMRFCLRRHISNSI